MDRLRLWALFKLQLARIQALALLTLAAAANSVNATTCWYFMGAEEGRIYAVTPDPGGRWWYNGALRFYWYPEDGGTTWLEDHGPRLDGNGSQLHDQSWSDQAEHIFYNGQGEFYKVRRGNEPEVSAPVRPNPDYRPDGTLTLYRDQSRDGRPDWEGGSEGQVVGPPGLNWANYLWVFGGGDGVIYAIDCSGDLFFYRHTASPPAGHVWDNAGEGQKISSGWQEFRQVFSGGLGVIYAIDHAGTLYYFRDLVRTGGINWHNGGIGVPIGPGWDRYQQVFSTGNDKIYGVDQNGQLFFYHITISGTTVTCVDCDEPACVDCGTPTRLGVPPLVPGPSGLALEPLTPLLKTGIYCWPLAAAPGEVIEFKISGVTTNVEFFRHWSTSADVVDELKESFRVTSDFQPIHHVPARHGCGWRTTLALTIPAGWKSGLYSARCRFTDGTTSDIAFVVKPRPDQRSGLAVIANVNTWLAYNGHWGDGKYGGRANCSFLRPNPDASPSSGLKHLARGELWILGWLQQRGIVADVYTDIDFHQGLVAPQAHCLILSTHPEYWSTDMYAALRGFLDQGGSLLYLGGNGIFERAEYSCDFTGMKFLDGVELKSREYSLFRDERSPLPSERSLLGVATEACDATGAAYQIIVPVRDPAETLENWELRQHRFRFVRGLSGRVGTSGYNTGDGGVVPSGMAAGWELDSSTGPGAAGFIRGDCMDIGCLGGMPRALEPREEPRGLVVLARATSPLGHATGCHPAEEAIAEMTYYDHPGGGFVFSVGSITFGGSLVKDPGLQQIVGNALAQCHIPVPCPENFLVNGSFEEPAVPDGYLAVLPGESTLPGWRVAVGSIDYHLNRASGTLDPVGSGPVAHGLHAVDLAGGPLGGILEQTFSTDPGQTYVLTFALGTSRERDRSGRATLRVSVAGVQKTLVTLHPTPELAWDRHRVVFRAASTLTKVRFTTGDPNDTSFCELDDVRVVSCACNPDLVLSGSFETPGIPDGYVSLPEGSELVAGWTVVGSGVEYFNVRLGGPSRPVSAGWAADGLYAIDLAGASGSGGIETTIPAVPGERYDVRFAIGTSQERGRTGNMALTASAPGISQEFTLNTESETAVWERREFQFIADAPSSTLRFETHASPDTSFVLLDDVQVHAVCPEPERPNLVIPSREVWRYLDDGSDQGTSWRAPGFTATHWSTGAARFGFAGAGPATALTPGHATYYFRHEFTVTNDAAFSSFQVRLQRDDGAVVYLNGTEVFRSNMSTGLVDYLTLASSTTSGADETTEFLSPVLPGSLLVSGENVVAVEVHQAGTNDSDLGFDLELEATPQPEPPGIVQQPVSRTVTEGDPLILSVIATGTPPLFYQWRQDGVAIAGATNLILNLGTTTTNDAGAYSVVIANIVGNMISSNAMVSVIRSCPFISCPPNITAHCTGPFGTVVTYSVLAGNPCNPDDFVLTCVPASGSFFPMGTTTVLCNNRAPIAGRLTQCAFTVTVVGDCTMATARGIPMVLLGNAIIDGRSDGSLRLSALGNTLEDGLRLDPGEVTGLCVEFDRFLRANELAGGAEFTAIARGLPGTGVAALRLVRGNSFAAFEVIPSFGLPGTWNYGVRFYNGDQLTHESLDRTAPPPNQTIRDQLILTALPRTMRVAVRPGGVVVYECSFGGPNNVSMFTSGNALNFSADRMEVFPSGPPVEPVESLSGLDLAFGGISERIITGMTVTKFGQEIRASQGVAMAGVEGGLVVGHVPAPAPAAPAPPKPPVVWNTVNPLGYFGDSLPGNPAGYNGYWEGVNPLGHVAQWDLKIDLTDNAAAPLGLPVYRPGKSSAELTLAIPTVPNQATLRVVAGGVADPAFPGALTVEMGSLVFQGKAGRVELGAEIPGTNSIPTEARQRLEVTLADGSVRTFDGTAGELRLSWDQAEAVIPAATLSATIGPEGALSLGIRSEMPGPVMVHLPGGASAQVMAMTWTATDAQTWTPGSLRGLLLEGNDNPPMIITGLNTSADNPTPASYFADHRISPLGNGTFRTDAFGSLVLSGLTQSGEDGVAIQGFRVADAALPGGPWLRMNLGYVPFFAGNAPPAGSRLDLRVLSEGNAVPNAVLAGESHQSAGSPLFFAVRFPNLGATHHTLRVFRGNAIVFDQPGRLNDLPTARGNLAPYALPDEVAVRTLDGRFTWVLTWNRVIAMEIYSQPGANPFLGDRVELAADDGAADPVGERRLELRAGSLGLLRLLNLGNRNARSVPALSFEFNAGRLGLNWDEVVSGRPRLQTAPRVDGPWRNFTLGTRVADGWSSGFELVPIEGERFTRLVTRAATEGCLDFSAAAPGDHPNPADFAGWKFERFGPNDTPTPLNEILELDGSRGLRFDRRLDIQLPALAAGVDVMFRRSGGAVAFIGFDDTGEVVRQVVDPQPSGGGAEAETIEAPPGRLLRRLRLLVAGGSVDLRELCLRAFPFQDVAQSRSCLPLRTAVLGAVANPWMQGDLTLTAHGADGATPLTGLISDYPNNVIVGYVIAHQVELKFAHPSPQVEIEFLSGSGSVDFEPFDDLGAALPVYHLDRVTSSYGETVVFTGSPRLIARVVVTSPAGKTRLMRICGGPVPASFGREVGDLTVRPTRNPQPVGDLMWTFYDAAHVLASSVLRSDAATGETGLDLTPETVIDFATDQLSADLRLVVDVGGAAISVEATAWGGGTFRTLPGASYAAGVHILNLTDYCGTCGVGPRLRRIRVGLTGGRAIVTRVDTPFRAEN